MRVQTLKADCNEERIAIILKVELSLEEIMHSKLNDEEKEILNFIIQNDNITQKQLSDIFGNVKACRVIQNLEKKGIIHRKRKGKTYLIKIT